MIRHRLYRARGLRGTRGQSIVELALVTPIFVLVLVGAAEFAHFAWSTVIASSAARAGAQYGAQTHVTASDTNGIRAAAALDSVNITGLATTSTTLCYCSSPGPMTSIACGSTALTSCPSPATILEFVQVNTAVTVYPLGSYPGLPTSFTAQGQSIMQVLQ